MIQPRETDTGSQREKLADDFGRNGVAYPFGIGVGFRGKSFASASDKEHRIELRTRWIVFMWLPLVPLGSYRVRMHRRRLNQRGVYAKSFELFSKEKLAWRQVLSFWGFDAVAIALMWFLSNLQ